MVVSKRLLVVLAGIVWYVGSIALLFKAGKLLVAAFEIDSESWAIVFAAITGILAGVVKSKFLFIKACQKNLARISSLQTPKIWQFYRTPFYFMLATTITLGGYLSTAAQGNYGFLLFVAGLDLSIGIALLTSGRKFWASPI